MLCNNVIVDVLISVALLRLLQYCNTLQYGLVCYITPLLIWSSRFETTTKDVFAWAYMNTGRAPKTKGLFRQIIQPRGLSPQMIGRDQIKEL